MATAHTTHRRTPRELHRVILSSKHKRLPNTRNYVVPNACFPSRLCHRSKNPYLAPDPDFLDWQCRVEKESYSTAAHLPCFHFHLDVTAKQSVGALQDKKKHVSLLVDMPNRILGRPDPGEPANPAVLVGPGMYRRTNIREPRKRGHD